MSTPTKHKQYNTFEPGAQLKVDHVKIDMLDETYTTSPALTFFPKDTNNTKSLDTLKKCKFCRKLFKDAENNDFACRHHTGKFSSSQYAFGVKRWTCCKLESETADGCFVTPHEEDEKTSTILSAFSAVDTTSKKDKKTPERQTSNGNNTNNGNHKNSKPTPMYSNGNFAQPSQDTLDFLAQLSQYQAASKESSSPSQQKKSSRKGKPSKPQTMVDEDGNIVSVVELQDSPKISYHDEDGHESNEKKESKGNAPVLKPGEVLHTVDKSDTLQGISLKYGVPVQDIKRANRMFSHSIFGYKTLIIPKPS